MKTQLLIAGLLMSSPAFAQTTSGYAAYQSGYNGSIACETAQARAYSQAEQSCREQGKALSAIRYSDCFSHSWLETVNSGPSDPWAKWLGYTGQSVVKHRALVVNAEFSCAADAQ